MTVVRALLSVIVALGVAGCAHELTPTPPSTSPPAVTTEPTPTPTSPAPEQTAEPAPPPVTGTPAPTLPAPPPSKYAACVAPAGMTRLLDQDPSDSQSPWKIPDGGDHAEIWFTAQAKDGWTAEWWGYAQQAATVWNTSPCLDVHVTQGACPAGKNCIPMYVDDGDGDDGNFNDKVKSGFTVGGDIHVLKTLSAKTDAKGCNERRNVVAHEMGHGVGLVHRNPKHHVLMNGDTFGDVCDLSGDVDEKGKPADTELANLAFDYGRQIKK